MKQLSLALFLTTICVATPQMVQAEDMHGHDEAMAAMMAIGSPNKNHQLLEKFAGEWTYTLRYWMGTGTEPQNMSGTSSNTLIFDGRYLEQTVTGDAVEGHPAFEGRGFTGYNNLRKEYESVWLDNMSTTLMSGSGLYNAETKTLNEKGEFSCSMTQETHRSYRAAWQIQDEDHHTYKSYMRDSEGKEYLAMEIKYTRAQ